MPHIFHNCATSYIKIDGKKIYLDDSYYALKKKKPKITMTISSHYANQQ